MPKKGYKQTKEHKEKNRIKLKGNKRCLGKHWKWSRESIEERKKNIKKGIIKVPLFYGKKHTKEWKEYMSQKMKGRFDGIHRSPKTEFKKGQKLIFNWKGDSASKSAKHRWIEKKLGKPKICEHCGKPAKDWANKNHKYNRKKLSDWMSLCKSCHLKYDYKFNNRGRK